MSLRRAFDYALRRNDRRGLILLYHRVATLQLDPQLLCVTPERFAEHLDVLRRLARPVPLPRVREVSSTSDPVPVAVTFDDGYADNLQTALPLLETADVPATFFIVSGLVGSDREFWWDELERVLLAGDELPPALEVRVDGDVLRFDLTNNSVRDPTWNVLREDMPSPRHVAYRSLMMRLRSLDPTMRDAVIDELRRWAGGSDGSRSSHRPLDESELRQLDAHELATVGAHTVGHPSLAGLSPSRQRYEVGGSKGRLEELVGHPVTSFSYPFGGQADYTPTTIAAVAGAGFELACANVEGRVGPRSDRFQLPRMLVRDWPGAEFERRLRAWMER
jgi:peptidoglycan/xylan/chitin deacetylase (PgdA/CDA1 family)